MRKARGVKLLDGIEREVWRALERASLSDLNAIVRASKRLSPVNCSWVVYGLGETIGDMARAEKKKSRRRRAVAEGRCA